MKNNFNINEFVNAQTVQSVSAELAGRVKSRRKEAGLSQQQLSSRSGVSFGSIRRFEKSGEISLSSLLLIAQALNCLVDFEGLFKNTIITSVKDYRK